MSFSEQDGAQVRDVAVGTRDGQSVRTVRMTRDYPTTLDDLWDAVTTPARLERWFLPVNGDLQPGGRYQLKGNAGGVIEHCNAPDTLHLTWEFGESVSWVEVTLSTIEGGARLTLAHITPMDEASQAHWRQYGPGATGVGWELGLVGLGVYFAADGAAIDPAEYQSWAESSAGKRFVAHSAAAWGEAHIAAGTDAKDARERAATTSAFYGGE